VGTKAYVRRISLVGVCVLIASLLGVYPRAAAAPVLPSGFADELVTAIGAPTALDFTPDGRMLVTTQPGALYVVQNDALIETPALDLSAKTCSNSERGLLGVAVDPDFTTNGYVYLYYTFNKFNNTCPTNASDDPVNRVSRFVLGSSNSIDPSTETVLIDNIPSANGNHNAGDLAFGKDGNLYVTVGDGGCDYAGGGCAGSNNASRDRNALVGKVLRITPSGGIPAGNPFTGSGTARCNNGTAATGTICQETYAWGLRNPFRIAFDPDAAATRFYINDVGQNVWEEIDLGTSGADYGWNVREGHCATGSTTSCGAPPSGMTNPIFDYPHASGCGAITGGAFVPSAAGWPAPYSGSYLFSDYNCGRIFRLAPNGSGGLSSSVFADGLGSSSAVDMAFHGGALYYTNYANGGEVHRIVLSASNRPPVASFTATPSSGPVPLDVTFDATASSDPDGDALTYSWDFGDGTTDEISGSGVTHRYSVEGTYTAMLTVQDGSGATSHTARTITAGNAPPSPAITAPLTTKKFSVGETITLSGRATDAQDGTEPTSRLSWTVILHHNTHTHPFLGPVTGNNITFKAPAPEDLPGAATSYLEIFLTATDSAGLSSTVSQNLNPLRVSLTFATRPAGLQLVAGGITFTAPQTFVSWKNYRITISAPSPQGTHRYRSWSDRGRRTHTITTPGVNRTYTATFT